MTTQLDSVVGVKREASYGAIGTPDHFPEYLTENFQWKKQIYQGHGFRAGSGVARNERRAVVKEWGEGDLELEMVARGVGIFLEAWLGASTSTGIVSLAAPAANGALSATAGGSLAAVTDYVRTTWTTASGESLAAPETSLAVPVNNVLNVAAPANPPVGATGWNVYVGATGAETRQNGSTPIALGTAWVEPTTGLVAGAALPTVGSAFAAYQQNFSLATSDPINSYTIQKSVPLLGGGAAQPHTFNGCVCTKGELTSVLAEPPKLKTSWNAKNYDTTVTPFAPPSFTAGNELFVMTEGAIAIGGTVTAPTTTALASGGTTVADIVDFSLILDNKLNVDGFTYGGGGKATRKPVLGERMPSGKITAEFDAVTLRDAYLNQLPLALLLTFTSTTVIQGGASPIYNVLQVYIPLIKLEGELPNSTNGVVRQSIPYTVLDGSSVAAGGAGVSPVNIILRTQDSAV